MADADSLDNIDKRLTASDTPAAVKHRATDPVHTVKTFPVYISKSIRAYYIKY
jgi:hypothetical protein